MIKFPAIFESFPEVRFVIWSHLYIVNWCTFLLWRHPEVFGDRGTAAFPTPSTVVALTLRSSTVSKTGFRFTSSNEENTLSFVLVAATSLCRSSWMCDPKLHVLSTVDSWFLQPFFFGIRGACSHGNSRQCQLLRNSNAWHVILIEVKGSPWITMGLVFKSCASPAAGIPQMTQKMKKIANAWAKRALLCVAVQRS